MTDKDLSASEKDVQKKALIPSAGHVTRWWSKIIRNSREALTGQRRSDLPTFLVRYINNNLPKNGVHQGFGYKYEQVVFKLLNLMMANFSSFAKPWHQRRLISA